MGHRGFGTWLPLSPKIRDFRGPRDFALPIRAKLSEDPNIVGTWVARLIAAPLNQRATTSEWTALNDFEELEMKRYVILPFLHSSEALWKPQ